MSPRAADLEAERALASRSPLLFGFFARVFRRALLRDFHAMRCACDGLPPDASLQRLVIYCNHPSWWDAVAFVLLADTIFRGRPGYVPIDAAMLDRYPFMRRIGAFGIAPVGRAGGVTFLATARQVLSRPDGLLLVTAQGRFADVRERPIGLKAGLAHLALLRSDVTFLPLALECVFWNERKPELLVSFGAPLTAASLAGRRPEQSTQVLESALETTMDALARRAISRDPAAFVPIVSGSSGVGGVYDAWRRLKAVLKGEKFSGAHEDVR